MPATDRPRWQLCPHFEIPIALAERPVSRQHARVEWQSRRVRAAGRRDGEDVVSHTEWIGADRGVRIVFRLLVVSERSPAAGTGCHPVAFARAQRC